MSYKDWVIYDDIAALDVHHHFPRTMTLETAYERGMIPKAKLEHLHVYGGCCRNADWAVWNAETQRFTYLRDKWGLLFTETIRHPEDDNGFDIFVPTIEVVLETE